jgi:hypothetical protein
MKFKHFSICALSLVAGLALSVACSSDDPADPAKLNVTPATVSATANGGASTITVDANVSWNAESDQTWVTVSGETNTSFVVNVAASTVTEKRTATVTVSGGGKSATVAVTQAAYGGGDVLSVAPSTAKVSAAGGESVFTVTSNIDWTAASDATWAAVSSASGSKDGTVTVTTEANDGASRTATITVTAGTLTQTATLTQIKGGCIAIADLQWENVTSFPLINTGKYIDKAQTLPCESALYVYKRIDAIPYKFTLTESGTFNIEERNTKCGVYIYSDINKVGNMSTTPDHGLVNYDGNGAWNPPISGCHVEPGTYYMLVYFRRDSDSDGDTYQLDFEMTFTPDGGGAESFPISVNLGATSSVQKIGTIASNESPSFKVTIPAAGGTLTIDAAHDWWMIITKGGEPVYENWYSNWLWDGGELEIAAGEYLITFDNQDGETDYDITFSLK